mgnify:FL=1
MEKKDEPIKGLSPSQLNRSRSQGTVPDFILAKEKAKEEERMRKEEEKRRKAHNASIREKINKLEKEKEKLQLESYAKARVLSNPRIFRDEDTARAYGRRLKEIDKLFSLTDVEIKELEKQII